MRNQETTEETPLVNLERHPLVLLVAVVSSGLIAYGTYALFKQMNPWGFIVMAPAAIFSFQTLWLLLNPFAIIFKDKLEIKQSFFHHKDRYFIDIKHISRNKKGRIYITYHDNEIERINLFGIKGAHVELLKSEIEKLLPAR